MADEEINIDIVTDADTSSLEALEDLIDDLDFKANELGMTLANSLSDADFTDTGLDTVSDDADSASESLDGMADSASGAGEAVDGINPDNVEKTGSSASESASDLDALASSAMAVGSVAGLDEMANTAGRIGDSWNQLDLTFGGVTADMKTNISSASASTGRSGATVRGYFNMMGIAGVKNSNLLASSFQSIAGRAYQTGQPIENLESSVQRMVLTGKAGSRQLTKLGLNTTDLGKAMGVTADQAEDAFSKLSQSERLQVLTKAMGDGKKANSDYANSWQGVKDKASATVAGLLGAVGKPMLTVLVPVMKQLTNLVNFLSEAIGNLPAPFQLLLGGVTAVGLGLITFVGSLAMVGKALSGLRSGLQTLGLVGEVDKDLSAFAQFKTDVNSIGSTIKSSLTTAVRTAKTAFSTLKTAVVEAGSALKGYIVSAWESVKASISSALAAIKSALAKVLEALHTVYDTIVKIANTIVTYALAVAEFLLASPILLVVIAVIAAVAIMLYLYNTNTQVKASVDWLIASFWNFLATLGAVISGGLAWIMSFATGVWAWLMNAWNGFLSFLGYLAGFPGRLWSYLLNAIQRVVSFGSSFVSNLRSSASRGVSSFINGMITLGSRVYSELQGTLNRVIEWGSQIVSKFSSIAQQAWSAFVNGLGIGSPGYIAINTEQELQRVANHADDYGGTFKSKFEALGSLASSSYLKGNSMVTDLPAGTGTGVTGGNTININIAGNVKDDATVDKIAGAVTKALSWNNTLAGRTIGDSSL